MVDHKVILARLQILVRQCGSQKAAAEKLNVSPQYLNDVLSGKSEPGPAILKAIGYERVVMYQTKGAKR